MKTRKPLLFITIPVMALVMTFFAPVVLQSTDTLGTAPLKWREQLASQSQFQHQDIFPGVDLVLSGSQEKILASLIVRPGSDLGIIQLDFSGVNDLAMDEARNVRLQTSNGVFQLEGARFFHENAGVQTSVEGKLIRLANGQVGVQVDNYDRNLPLTINFSMNFGAGGGGEDVTINAVPTIEATKRDAVVGGGDANPGDNIKYTVVIKNTGADTAQSVEYDDNIDPNTSFVNGTLSTTPLADDKTTTVLEDVQTPITLTGRDPDGDNLTFTINTPPTLGSLGPISPAGPTSASVNYTSNLNKNGADSFVFKVQDNDSRNDLGTVGITITPVNDAPVFSCGPNQTHSTSDGPTITVPGWATGIAPGPATATDESGQALTFNVTGNTNPALFTTGPAVNASNGNLTYTLAAITGQSTITLELSDNGGTLNSGDDTSNPCSFTVFVNGPPTAVDDNYNTSPNTTISRTTSDPDDLLDNDNLGTPAATLTSFGGGDLGGSVTGHAAGSTVSPLPSFGNGSLTVNANGSFTFTPPTGFTGDYTFDYRITNVAGTSDATVTISVQAGPTAVADNYFTTVNTSLSRATSDPDDLLDNDNLGTPAATLTSFGGGSLGGVVTTNAAGASVSLAGGTLTVNSDGSFSLATPTTPGSFNFQYRLTNIAGTSDAVVTIEVRQAPTAVADNYSTQPNTTISRTASDPDDLLDNDNLGFPLATLQSFGGGSLGGAVTDHAAGSTVSPLPSFGNGSLTVNANGSFSFTPPTGFTGNYTFDYYITNVAGSSAATVTIAVQAMPVAAADNYFTNINTPISRATSDPDDLLDNDNLGSPAATLTSFGGGTLGGTVTTNAAGTTANVGGHSLTVNANGSFTYSPASGFTGNFTFNYRLTNVSGTSDALVTIEVRQAPTAVADSYNTLVNTTLTVNTSDPNDLLDNDTRGFPLATIASFGGGSLGGAVTDHPAGTSAALAGGTLQVNSDGSFSLTTPTTTGNFTFDYYITSVAGSSAATVTIEVRKAPTAVADNYTTPTNVTISRTTSDSDGLLDNDDRGFPLATIINFGGGSLGGTVTTNVAGASVPLAGGTLTVNSDGSFSLTTPTTSGSFNFQYRLSNVAGFSDATVTIDVQGAPDAINDAPVANSVPGNAFHTALNTALNSSSDPITPSVLANDNLGFPAGTLTHFGGGDLGGAVTDNAAGSTVNFGAGGSLQVLASGEFVFTPSTGFTGLFTFQYRLTNTAGSDDATVTIAVGVRPQAVADARTATGNVRLSTATNLLNNDTGDQLTVTASDVTSAQGGDVSVSTNGSFTYNPPAGFEGPTDSFNYTAGNGFGSGGSVTVSITVSGMIWFIDNSAASAGDGRLASPFNTLAAFEAINGNAGALNPQAGDDIFIYDGSGSYTGGLTLESNQKLIGDGASGVLATILGITLATGSDPLPVFSGTDPVIENTGGNGISVASDNTIRGLTVGNTPAANAGILGNGIGTLTVTDVSINGTGQILSLNNGTVNATFNALSTTSTTQTAVVLSNLVAGSVTDNDASGSSISGASGAFSITSGTTTPVSLTFNGDVTHTGANPLVIVQNHNTGTITFQNGTMTSTGGGLTFLNADGTYNFNGTTTLGNGTARIAISGLSSGSFNFSSNTSVTNPSNVAFDLDGSNATVDYNGTLSSNTAFRLVSITNNTGGSATFDGSSSATVNTLGIHIQQNTGGNFSFTNASKVINTSATGNTAVNVASNTGVTINFTGGGLDIDSNSGIGFNASGGGTINVSGANNSINTADGVAIDFDGPALGMTFASVSSASSSGAGIQLDNISGTLTMNGGSLTGATLTEFDVGDVANGSGGNATVVYAGSITNTAGRAVLIQELSGGSYTLSGNISHSAAGVGIQVSEINNGTAATITFSGASKTVNSGASNGVHLTNNTNGTIEFTNGGLDIDATSGIGFNATGGGIVNVTGTSNSITTTTGTALNVVSTTIGASGLTFQSISSSSSGTATGIILDNTGTSGGLTVTGAGTAGSGGTIANKTGANGSTTTGIGIYLNSTSSVSLTRLQLNDFQNYAIRGNSVTGFTLSNCIINGANGDNSGEGANNEGSIRFDNLLGSASISSSTVTGGSYDNVSVFNTSGSLNRLTVSSTTLATSTSATANDALRFEGSGAATTMNITVQNSSFTAARGDLFNAIDNGNTAMDVVFTGNACSNNHSFIVSGGGGITLAGSATGFSPTVTYDISGSNTFRDALGNAITIFKGNGGGSFSGQVANNTIGTATSLSGSSQASGIRLTTSGAGTHTTLINNNTVQQYNEAGIYVLLTDGSATMNATITNNSTTAFSGGGTFAFAGLFVDAGALPADSHFLCAAITGNNFSAGDPFNSSDIILSQNAATTIRLPDYLGAAGDVGAVSAFVIANNPTAGTTASASVSGSGGGFVGGAACTTP